MKKTPKPKWPTTIPWPEEGEFCRAHYWDGRRCCLLGWINVAINGSARDCRASAVRDMVMDKMTELAGKRKIWAFNDTHTDVELAELWAKTWESFGYLYEVES